MPKATEGSLKDIAKRKQVFKPVLDNAYTQSHHWPVIPPNQGQEFVALLRVLLSPVGHYNRLAKEGQNKLKVTENGPKILQQLTLGFNSTVKALERQVGKQLRIVCVFVCTADILPAILTNFFPTLACTLSFGGLPVKLIQLPKGSMGKLSEYLGIPHTGIIGMEGDIQQAGAIYQQANLVQPVKLPWLDNDKILSYLKPNIKVLLTLMPIKVKKVDKKGQK